MISDFLERGQVLLGLIEAWPHSHPLKLSHWIGDEGVAVVVVTANSSAVLLFLTLLICHKDWRQLR
jgi:hypothetical protein